MWNLLFLRARFYAFPLVIRVGVLLWTSASSRVSGEVLLETSEALPLPVHSITNIVTDRQRDEEGQARKAVGLFFVRAVSSMALLSSEIFLQEIFNGIAPLVSGSSVTLSLSLSLAPRTEMPNVNDDKDKIPTKVRQCWTSA